MPHSGSRGFFILGDPASDSGEVSPTWVPAVSSAWSSGSWRGGRRRSPGSRACRSLEEVPGGSPPACYCHLHCRHLPVMAMEVAPGVWEGGCCHDTSPSLPGGRFWRCSGGRLPATCLTGSGRVLCQFCLPFGGFLPLCLWRGLWSHYAPHLFSATLPACHCHLLLSHQILGGIFSPPATTSTWVYSLLPARLPHLHSCHSEGCLGEGGSWEVHLGSHSSTSCLEVCSPTWREFCTCVPLLGPYATTAPPVSPTCHSIYGSAILEEGGRFIPRPLLLFYLFSFLFSGS